MNKLLLYFASVFISYVNFLYVCIHVVRSRVSAYFLQKRIVYNSSPSHSLFERVHVTPATMRHPRNVIKRYVRSDRDHFDLDADAFKLKVCKGRGRLASKHALMVQVKLAKGFADITGTFNEYWPSFERSDITVFQFITILVARNLVTWQQVGMMTICVEKEEMLRVCTSDLDEYTFKMHDVICV